jgi:hypothetical protein
LLTSTRAARRGSTPGADCPFDSKKSKRTPGVTWKRGVTAMTASARAPIATPRRSEKERRSVRGVGESRGEICLIAVELGVEPRAQEHGRGHPLADLRARGDQTVDGVVAAVEIRLVVPERDRLAEPVLRAAETVVVADVDAVEGRVEERGAYAVGRGGEEVVGAEGEDRQRVARGDVQ